MKITDLRCAVIGKHPIVRIVTDEGLYGLGEVEFTKTYSSLGCCISVRR